MVTAPLPEKNITRKLKEWERRVLFFDPSVVYTRINANHHKRFQSISIKTMFPKNGKMCGCGCSRKLTGRQTRWATEDCYLFANSVWAIITGHIPVIRRFIKKYHGRKCVHCRVRPIGKLEVDHIIAVKHGGGCGWLSNYQLLCTIHHRRKTKDDLGRKGGSIDCMFGIV